MRVCLPRQTSTSRGSRDSEVKALTVMAWIWPRDSVATTVTPVGNRPTVRRNILAPTPWLIFWSLIGLILEARQELSYAIHIRGHVMRTDEGTSHAHRVAEEVALVEHLARAKGG